MWTASYSGGEVPDVTIRNVAAKFEAAAIAGAAISPVSGPTGPFVFELVKNRSVLQAKRESR